MNEKEAREITKDKNRLAPLAGGERLIFKAQGYLECYERTEELVGVRRDYTWSNPLSRRARTEHDTIRSSGHSRESVD